MSVAKKSKTSDAKVYRRQSVSAPAGFCAKKSVPRPLIAKISAPKRIGAKMAALKRRRQNVDVSFHYLVST